MEGWVRLCGRRRGRPTDAGPRLSRETSGSSLCHRADAIVQSGNCTLPNGP